MKLDRPIKRWEGRLILICLLLQPVGVIAIFAMLLLTILGGF